MSFHKVERHHHVRGTAFAAAIHATRTKLSSMSLHFRRRGWACLRGLTRARPLVVRAIFARPAQVRVRTVGTADSFAFPCRIPAPGGVPHKNPIAERDAPSDSGALIPNHAVRVGTARGLSKILGRRVPRVQPVFIVWVDCWFWLVTTHPLPPFKRPSLINSFSTPPTSTPPLLDAMRRCMVAFAFLSHLRHMGV